MSKASRLGRALGLAVAAALSAALIACTPRIQPPGPGPATPEMTDRQLRVRDGLVLPLSRWLPEGPVTAAVVALHGFNDYRNAFTDVGPEFARHGIATYAYDQRGFGQSPYRGIWPGQIPLIEDLIDASRLVRARHPDVPLYVLGESMGGAVAMASLARPTRPDIDGVILASPAVWGRRTMPDIQVALLELVAHLMPALAGKNQGLMLTPSDNIEMLRALGRDPLIIKETRIDAVYGLVALMDAALAATPQLDVPALILYGSRDDIIERKRTCTMLTELRRGAGRQWRLALYPKGYHMLLRDLQADTVIADILAWIDDRSAPLPSQNEAQPDRISAFCDKQS